MRRDLPFYYKLINFRFAGFSAAKSRLLQLVIGLDIVVNNVRRKLKEIGRPEIRR